MSPRQRNRPVRSARRWAALPAPVAVAALLAGAAPAAAEVEGPCVVTLAGVDAADRDSRSVDDAIVVRGGDLVPATFLALPGIVSYQIDLELAGFRVPVKRREQLAVVSGNLLQSTRFTRWAAGYYRVVGSAELLGGGTCSGAVMVRVDANPLLTVSGIVALVALAGGGAMVAVAAARELRGPAAAQQDRPAP